MSAPRETTSVLDFGEPDAVEAAEVLDFGADASRESPSVGDVLDFGASDTDAGSAPSGGKVDSRLQWGRQLAGAVGRESAFHVRAIYLRGLYDLYENQDQDAVHAFQEVVRQTNPRVVERPDTATRELGILSLGRMHYAHKQFDRSIYYYRQINRDSRWWLTALLESSWAYLRRSDFDKALGNLLTLHSPFFERQYFPESMLIKSIIYYEACRYDEAREFSDGFLAQYRPLMEQFQAAVDSEDSRQWLQLLLGEREGDAAAMGEAFGDLVLRDPELRSARRRMLGFQEEEKLLLGLTAGSFADSGVGRALGVFYKEGRGELL
jgi:tetratricopeptide (TPR) repeat protein